MENNANSTVSYHKCVFVALELKIVASIFVLVNVALMQIILCGITVVLSLQPAPPTTDDSEQPPPSYESLSTTGLEHLPQTTNSPTTANTAATSELIVQSQADGVGVGEHAPEPEDGPLPPPYSPGMRRNASTNAGTAHEEGLL